MEIQKAMHDLDIRIWKKYYPDGDIDDAQPELHAAYIWLRNDIVHILADKNGELLETYEEIVSMIRSEEYGDEILKCICMDSILEEVKIRADYLSALRKVKNGSVLAGSIGHCLGKKDLCQLAKLHKSNKCRKKIEDLLTACNFHYECGQFAEKKYSEFLAE